MCLKQIYTQTGTIYIIDFQLFKVYLSLALLQQKLV